VPAPGVADLGGVRIRRCGGRQASDFRELGERFEVDAGLLVPGVAVWVGGDERPAAFPGASDGMRVGLGACELADGPGACLV
jgi:hypothetical protein